MTVLTFPVPSPVEEQEVRQVTAAPAVRRTRRRSTYVRGSRSSGRGRVVRPAPRALTCAGTLPSPATLRLTARGRAVVALLWVAIVAVAVLGVVRPWSDTRADQRTESVAVQPGDTLWDLARQLTPAADPRGTVSRIVELNGLASAGDIHPGDQLLVPAG